MPQIYLSLHETDILGKETNKQNCISNKLHSINVAIKPAEALENTQNSEDT